MDVRRLALLTVLASALPLWSHASQPQQPRPTHPATAVPLRWTSIGPTIIAPTGNSYDQTPSSGRVSALALASTRLLAATANGGIWARAPDTGIWSPLTEDLPNLSFGAVAVAPSNPEVIYAATGEAHDCIDCGYGDDIYKSTDGGRTWTETASIPKAAGAVAMQSSAIAVDPANPNIVWIGTTLGVYRSADGGATWQSIWSPRSTAYAQSADPPIVDLKLDPREPSVAYFTDRRYIWRFDPNGHPRLSTTLSVPAPTMFATQNPQTSYTIAIAIAPSHPDTLYASYAYSGNFRFGCLAGLYRSDDRGRTWAQVMVPATRDYFSQQYAYGSGTGCQGWYDNTIGVDPLDENRVVAGGIVAVEIDATAVTAPVITNLTEHSASHPDIHAILFDPYGNLYLASDGGVWRYGHSALSVANGDRGRNLSTGLAVTQFYAGGSWLPHGEVLAGSQDNGTEMYSLAIARGNWLRVAAGDGGYTGADWKDPNIIYHEYFQGAIERSDDRGRSWTMIMPPFISAAAVSWVMPYLVDKRQPDTLVAGADGEVFVTSTGGLPAAEGQGNWTVLKGSGDIGLDSITSIDEGRSPNQLVAGDSEGLVAWTLDAGNDWSTWNAPADVSGERPSISLVQFDASGPQGLFVSYRYADSPFAAHLVWLKILAGRVTTRDCSSGLGAPVDALLQTAHGLLAGTDRGVYLRDSGSSVWARDTSASGDVTIPAVPVVDLKLQPRVSGDSARVVALTHGRGAWRSSAVSFLTAGP